MLKLFYEYIISNSYIWQKYFMYILHIIENINDSVTYGEL